jgi:ribonuclease D
MIATDSELAELLPLMERIDRIAVDTEADSLHCYFEKLCLMQLSFGGNDYLVDPLAGFDLAPLADALTKKEIVLQGADFDLRLLRRSLNFVPTRVFDTVIAARLLGIREFSLAALVQRFFGIVLTKGSQKANWAQRPMPRHMAEYAMNDTRYLLPLAEKLETDLRERGRLDWFRQSCQRAIESTLVQRVRDEDEAWRISGSGKLDPRASAILRELWQWREKEAQGADRPAFHILQNQLLIEAARSFAAGEVPDFRHFSVRRRTAFREAAERALHLPESAWPVRLRRRGVRPTPETEKAAEALRRRRDAVASEHGLEPSFIAPRGALDAVAADETRSTMLLAPWQRNLLELG